MKAKPPIAFLAIGGFFNSFLNQSDGFNDSNERENSCKMNIRANREGGAWVSRAADCLHFLSLLD